MSPFIRPPSVQLDDRLAAIAVGLIAFAIYLFTASGMPDNPDAEVEFQTTRALCQHGRLAIGDTPEAAGIVENRFNVAPGGPGREARWYSWFGVGQAISGMPLYFAGLGIARFFPEIEQAHAETEHFGYPRSEYFAHLFVGLRNPILGACTAALVVLCAARLRARRFASWWCGITYALCTFAWPQARSTLSDVQATFLLFAAFHQMLVLREARERQRRPHPVHWFLLGGALGLAVLTRIAVLPAALFLFILALLLLRQERTLEDHRARTSQLAFGLPLVGCGAFLLTVNWLRFGSPWETGYGVALADGTFFSYPFHWGLAGLLVSPGKGLLWMAPGLIVLPLGLRRAFSTQEYLWPTCVAGLAVALIVPVALTQTWHGAHTYGPRYLLPLLPFVWLGVGYVLEGRRMPGWARPLLIFLFGVGALVQLPGALVDYRTHLDLALQGARLEWPTPEGGDEAQEDEARFQRIQWDPRFAAPWAHWRIFRHRYALGDEIFPVREIFFLDFDTGLTPAGYHERGFHHIAWVDLEKRLEGRAWPLLLFVGLSLLLGVGLSLGSLDRERE